MKFYSKDTDSFDYFFKLLEFEKLVKDIKTSSIDVLVEDKYINKIHKTKGIQNKLNLYKVFITRLDDELGNYLVEF